MLECKYCEFVDTETMFTQFCNRPCLQENGEFEPLGKPTKQEREDLNGCGPAARHYRDRKDAA